MNYTLTINLEGDDKVNAQLDKLLSGVSKISQGKIPKMSFEEWLEAGDPDKAGEKAGKKIGNAVAKGFKSIGWNSKEMLGTPRLPDVSKFLPKDKDKAIKGLREVTGADVDKVQSLPDINSFSQKQDWKKILIGLGLGVSNPYIGSRLLSDELAKGGGSGGAAGGIFGKGGIAGFSEIFLAFKAFRFAVDVFKWGAEKFMEAVKRADRFYSNALKNGLGLGFSVRRQTLAEIMGVSEEDVFRFGSQMKYLDSRIKQATSILAETAVPLTQVSYEFKILKTDLSATWAILANQVAPAVLQFVGTLDELLKMFNKIADSKIFKSALTAALDFAFPAYGAFDLLGKIKQSNNPMPSPQAWMKQLPASHWEKMGLVVMGGTTNYQKQIAQNTKSIAKNIEKMVKGNGSVSVATSFKNAFNWNMSRSTNNP